MKKLIILTLVALTFTVSSFGQQVPMYSHYYFNKFLYNPALTGDQSYGQAYMIYRNQWNNVPDAPRTKAVTVDGPLKNKKVGIGVSLYQDNAGVFNSTGGKFSYRYGLQMSKKATLNMGLSLGFLDNRIDFNKLTYKDDLDPLILSQYNSETGFDATFGFNFIYDKFQIGLSVPQVLANELAYESIGNIATEDAVYGLTRHYIATARYDFQLTDELSFEPTAMVRATPGAPTQYDINAMFNYDDRFWLGGMYRSAYAATFSGAARLFNQIVAGYSYDLAVNTNKQFLRGAHEVMLGWQFGDDKETKKLFKDLGDRVKKNEDDIKENRYDVDQNDKDIDELKDDDEDLEEENKRLEEQLKELRLEFEDFKKSREDGSLQAGDIFSFNNVYFATNKSDIRGTDRSELDNLVNILKEEPTMTLAIMGHTDLRGSVAFNDRLSKDRAESVRQYLIGRGISSTRLNVQSFGESLPVSEDLQQNRRVEFKVLTK